MLDGWGREERRGIGGGSSGPGVVAGDRGCMEFIEGVLGISGDRVGFSKAVEERGLDPLRGGNGGTLSVVSAGRCALPLT